MRNDRSTLRVLAAELAECPAAAWVIDPTAAQLIAANEAGRIQWDLPQHFEPLALDPSLPALARLREIGLAVQDGAVHRETLSFTTPKGELRLSCRVRPLRIGARAPLLLVCAASDAGREATTPAPISTGPASLPADDAETLRKIARQIRSGEQRAEQRPHCARDAHARAGGSSDGEAAAEGTHSPFRQSELAKLAHELKTPLSAIAAAAEVMSAEHYGPLGDPRYRSYAAAIHGSARHALAVLNGLLGRDAAPELTFTELDLNTIAESAMSAMGPLAERAGLRLHTKLAPKLPRIVADETSLKQILLNLLTNALKFTPQGGEIWLRTAYVLDGPVRVSVRDTGRGMTACEIRAAVEDRDLQDTLSALGGIGLPLVRTLAEANGGRLSLKSKPGKGTTAIVSFPKGRVIPV